MPEEAPLLVEAVPELAEEIERELRAAGYEELAAQTAGLRMMKSCGCGDDFCATLYTSPLAGRPSGKKRFGIPLPDHHLIVHVLEGEIIEVEVLYRDDLRPKIRSVFGDEADWRRHEGRAEQS